MLNISSRCIGCDKCVTICPFAAMQVINKMAVVNEACTLCGACVQVCPVDAIAITHRERTADLSAFKGVWVFVETADAARGKKSVRAVAHELLSVGRKLAGDLGEELCAVLAGDSVAGLTGELASFGADKVYLVEHPELAVYNTDIFSTVITALITKYKPGIMLYPATITGRDLAPRIAAAIKVGLTADCTGLAIKDGLLVQSRPAFGGNIMADILSPDSRPQMATVRPNVMKKCEPRKGAQAVVVRETPAIDGSMARVKILERKVTHAHAGDRIEDARVIISGGRGLKGKEKFRMLEELAERLGGAVGASRAAVDMGMRPKTHQVGQSGVTVCPKLYLSCGISGAVQHIVGMRSSDVIISINKDPNAPIFNVSKYGLVGNLHEILPKLIERLKKKT
ncbi:MAG: FAD-binding protein [bacterium]